MITITLPTPVSLLLPVSRTPRQRITGPSLPMSASAREERQIARLTLTVKVDPEAREIRGTLSPLSGAILLYGPKDFAAAAGDTPEEHAARVLEILGADHATFLQSIADHRPLPPPPPRVPREVPNWRMKAILTRIGMLDAARSALESLPPQARDVALLAWDGDAHFSRRSPSVEFIASALGISAIDLDEIFIAAGNLEV